MAPGWEWSLQTCDGPRYRLTGNDSEKNLAENNLRAGPGSRPNMHNALRRKGFPRYLHHSAQGSLRPDDITFD